MVGRARIHRRRQHVALSSLPPRSTYVLAVYANSLLVTLNSRKVVRDGLSSKQATTISYTVPLSRINPGARSHDGTMAMAMDYF